VLQEININHSLLELKSFLQQDFLYLAEISCICFMAFLIQILLSRVVQSCVAKKAVLDPVLLFQVKQIIGSVYSWNGCS